MQQRPFTVGFVAGETSGDILGAGLIRSLKQIVPNAYFIGVTGPLMKKEGCETLYDIEEISCMGIIEVLRKLPRLLQIRFNLIKRFTKLQPDVFIGIDAPDFNLFLEKKLKQTGIKTIHYVSPSIWAWRQNRIFTIRSATDLVLTLYPFEKKIYDSYNISCRFVGHTIADIVPLKPNKQAARIQLNINNDVKCLTILPGSRYYEVKMLSVKFLQAAKILTKDFPNLQILVPVVNKKRRQQFEKIYKDISLNLPLKILDRQSLTAMITADVTLLASGTATLECMLAKCPMVVGYKIHPITYWLVKRFIKLSFISLPNLLANKKLINEFIQKDCQPKKLAQSLKDLLTNKKKVKYLKQIFFQLHQSIRCNADQKAAKEILKFNKNK
ncbi:MULTISPECIES: lipid-A-disaccharide synthase [Arsenophonus]|uniref:lipid-A-disaccharide synthase n=1 Tax=Arsenophonus TaxID=637 RepID=UPI00083387BC|nr:lipid-A-disaccharide synthase [Candidatus Arsenophonus lipoptenae]